MTCMHVHARISCASTPYALRVRWQQQQQQQQCMHISCSRTALLDLHHGLSLKCLDSEVSQGMYMPHAVDYFRIVFNRTFCCQRLHHARHNSLLLQTVYVSFAGSSSLLCLPAVQQRAGRFSAMSIRASAATLEVATKQNVGASASKSQTHVGLNSGHIMPLLGWGTSQATGDECVQATKAAIEAGFRVRHCHNYPTACMLLRMHCNCGY